MKGWQMYSGIHQLKALGLNKAQIARKLLINVKTVSKYWEMAPDEFVSLVQNQFRTKVLEDYEAVVTAWLRKYPDLSSSQIWDWLEEHYQLGAKGRTVRRFVSHLRKKHNIPKPQNTRQYEAVDDPPMGFQMQVDIGIISVRKAYESSLIKLYCVAFVLSHSRYKYGVWFDRPLTAADFVRAIESCFDYMGGRPQELVFDQDKLLAVSENYGDVIYTYEFEKFRQSMGFEVRLCRAADPESKGRIEAVVKFFKNNFAKNRLFMGLRTWDESFEDWLLRTGNGRVHSVTKKIPAQVFAAEAKSLKPVLIIKNSSSSSSITRLVHKDNTVFFEGNRYTVPVGTYKPGLEVELIVRDGLLRITDPYGDIVYAEHPVSMEKGRLVKNNNHRRDRAEKIDRLYENAIKKFKDEQKARKFLQKIRELKSRYVRDQYLLILKILESEQEEAISQALTYCCENELFSAVDFRDAVQYFNPKDKDKIRAESIEKLPQNVIPITTVKAQKRSLQEYSRLTGGARK